MLDRPQIVLPDIGQVLRFGRGKLTRHGEEFFGGVFDLEYLRWRNAHPPMAGGSGSLSNFAQVAALQHLTGQDNGAWANLSPVYLALCTAAPDSSKTGTTIAELVYTTYARTSLANTAWNAGAAGGAGVQSTIKNNGVITGPACTAGSATCLGWAICSALTVGNMLAWGSATSTVISTTQTPPQVADQGITIGIN